MHPETVADWAAWPEANHTRGGVWFVSWKRHTGRATVSYDDAVTEALRFGWIDSLGRRLAAAFGEHPGSREQWDGFPPSARRAILEWIVQAKRAPTRASRVAETARRAAQGERANQWRPKR